MFFGTEMETKILKTTSQLLTSTENFSEDSPEEPLIKNRFFGVVPPMVGFRVLLLQNAQRAVLLQKRKFNRGKLGRIF
jgi:hypothetical protein